jgi:hypothetical protein
MFLWGYWNVEYWNFVAFGEESQERSFASLRRTSHDAARRREPHLRRAGCASGRMMG